MFAASAPAVSPSAGSDAAEALRRPRLYVEIQRHNLDHERAVEPALVELAYRLGVPLVATNEPYFADASDYRGA